MQFNFICLFVIVSLATLVQGDLCIEPECTNPSGKKGLTWTLRRHVDGLNMDMFGCNGCDPYAGDTDCGKKRSILCINKQKLNRPAYDINCTAASAPAEYYCGWSGGLYGATPPVRGCNIKSQYRGNKFCAASLGEGWVMAEFHDGAYIVGMSKTKYAGNDWKRLQQGGWNAYGYSNINKVGSSDVDEDRHDYWVYINDQTANCWNIPPSAV
jgi:hypothetical protein